MPGKDSWKHRNAGATEVLVSSANRFALMHELRGASEPSLPELLSLLSPVDLVIVEGFKADSHPKIEVYRAETGKDLLHGQDKAIVAVASDVAVETHLPVLHLDDIEKIADMMLACAVPLADVLAGADEE